MFVVRSVKLLLLEEVGQKGKLIRVANRWNVIEQEKTQLHSKDFIMQKLLEVRNENQAFDYLTVSHNVN